MALRIEKRISALLVGLGLLATPLLAEPEFRYEAWHGHSRPPHIKRAGKMGTLTITSLGVSFEEAKKEGKKSKPKHTWRWSYQDIQQLKIGPKSLTVLTYQDNKWKLGVDREYEFDLVSDKTFEDAYNMLKLRLDQRFVAAMPSIASNAMWEMPAKHLIRLGGDQGILQVSAAEIVYKSAKRSESRTWRYQDIENISSSGPFQLTITTFEHAPMTFGSRKSFEFQLKERLDEARFNELWLRLNRSKGLQILNSYRDPADGSK